MRRCFHDRPASPARPRPRRTREAGSGTMSATKKVSLKAFAAWPGVVSGEFQTKPAAKSPGSQWSKLLLNSGDAHVTPAKAVWKSVRLAQVPHSATDAKWNP